MSAAETKQRHPEAFAAYEAWRRGLTRKGDPARLPDLSWEAFRAGWEIGRQLMPVAERLATIEGRQELLATVARTFVLTPEAERQFILEWERLGEP